MKINRQKLTKEIVLYGLIALAAIAGSYLYKNMSTSSVIVQQTGDYSAFGVTEETPIVIYTATWCDACKALKKELSELGVKYTNFDSEIDKNRFSLLQEQNINVIPVIFINNTMVQGFDKGLLNSLLPENAKGQL